MFPMAFYSADKIAEQKSGQNTVNLYDWRADARREQEIRNQQKRENDAKLALENSTREQRIERAQNVIQFVHGKDISEHLFYRDPDTGNNIAISVSRIGIGEKPITASAYDEVTHKYIMARGSFKNAREVRNALYSATGIPKPTRAKK